MMTYPLRHFLTFPPNIAWLVISPKAARRSRSRSVVIGFPIPSPPRSMPSPHPSPIRQPPLHFPARLPWVKGLGIELSADPPHELLVLVVTRVGEDLQELLVARDPAHVFGRAGSLSFQTQRVTLTRLNPQAALEEYLMPPGIPEVVLVLEAEPFAALWQDLAQNRRPGILVVHLREVFLKVPRVSV